MFRSLFARRLVSGVSVVMLLLCQTAAATLASAAAPLPLAAQVAAVDTALPCHDAARIADDAAADHGCKDRCPSRDVSVETAKVNIPAAAGLALPALSTPPYAAATVTAHEQIHACAAPPPLLLVYCRLLI